MDTIEKQHDTKEIDLTHDLGYTIVTGEPRSGTSMTMSILKALGIPVWGQEKMGEGSPKQDKIKALRKKLGFTEVQEDLSKQDLKSIEKRKERTNNLNERFWEIPGLVMQGLQYDRLILQRIATEQDENMPVDVTLLRMEGIDEMIRQYRDHKGHAVKIISNGLANTEIDILSQSKIVWSTRSPRSVAMSQMKLENASVQVVKEDDATEKDAEYWGSPKGAFSPWRWLRGNWAILKLMERRPELKDRIIAVDFDAMHENSTLQIDRIIKHIGISPSDEQIKEAMAVVNPDKKRSTTPPEPKRDQDAWAFADHMYELILKGDYAYAVQAMTAFLECKNHYSAKWRKPYLDTFDVPKLNHKATWWSLMGGQNLVDLMTGENRAEDKMHETRKGLERGKWQAHFCPYFNQDGPLYSTPFPDELGGDVSRKMVNCRDEGNVTLEHCQKHWETQMRSKCVVLTKANGG